MKCYCCEKEDELNPLTALSAGWVPFSTPCGGTITLCPNCSRAVSFDIMNVIYRHQELQRREIVMDIPYKEVKIECQEILSSS